LKWIQSTFAGVDALFNGDISKNWKDVKLTRLGGVFGPLMSEYLISQIISRERSFAKLAAAQKLETWAQQECATYRPLSSLRVGVMGLGSIGLHFCRVSKFFGMTVHGFRRFKEKNDTGFDHAFSVCDRLFGTKELNEFLSSADYIVNVLPSTKQTRGMLTNKRLKACANFVPDTQSNLADGVCFINVGRGDIVDEDSLILALQEKWISSVILDVFAREPLSQTSALWKMPLDQVVITPHVSAVSLPSDVADVFYKNLQLYESGSPMLFTVNVDKGY